MMAAAGIIEDHADPHKSLTNPPKSRLDFLAEAVIETFNKIGILPPTKTENPSRVEGPPSQSQAKN